jgi:flagellar hook-associated protein 2
MSTSSITSSAGQAAITALRSGSGIDVQTLATDLTNASKAGAQKALDDRRKSAEAQISSVAKVMNAADTFRSGLVALGDVTALQRAPFSSDASKVSVESSTGRLPPAFSASLEVTQLAREPSIRFAPVASLDTGLLGADGKSRTITFVKATHDAVSDTVTKTAGQTEIGSVTIDASTTLASLRDQINAVPGLSAVIVNGGASGYHLSVKGPSGAANTFLAEVANTDASALAGDGIAAPTGTAVTHGRDALITIDGIPATSSTNRFDDAVEGMKIGVGALTGGAPVTIGARTNSEALTTATATIVSGFNTMLETVKTESAFNADPAKRGGLSNNSAVSALLSQLRRFTTQPVAGTDGKSYTLAEIGVKTNRDGTLSLDPVRFASVLNSDPARVETVLGSMRSVSDGRLSVLGATRETAAGLHEIKRTATGWTINDTAAVLTGTTLAAASGSAEQGLQIVLPTAVQTGAATGWTARVSYSRGMVERFSDMLADLKDTQSAFGRLTASSKVALGKLETEQQALDDGMDRLKARYLKQFAAMDGLVGRGKSTQDSLTNFMTAWSNSLK